MKSELTPIMPVISDEDADERVRAVFDDIRSTRKTDFVNNFWRVIANDPAQLERTWAEVRDVTAPGALDALTKQLVYVAVSTVSNCTYCIRSHCAAARALGATEEMMAELFAVVGVAVKTNRLSIGLQIPVDDVYS
jgi:AhpD family alkylhydroperoxidase